MSHPVSLKLVGDSRVEFENIRTGVFSPLNGFMTGREYKSVVEKMRLTNGSPWTLPVTLEIPEDLCQKVATNSELVLQDEQSETIGFLEVQDVYKVDLDQDVQKVFGTTETKHPGVLKETSRSIFRVGGRIRATPHADKAPRPERLLTPFETRNLFLEKKWKTVVGFQTRNPCTARTSICRESVWKLWTGFLFNLSLVGKKWETFPRRLSFPPTKLWWNCFIPSLVFCLGLSSHP